MLIARGHVARIPQEKNSKSTAESGFSRRGGAGVPYTQLRKEGFHWARGPIDRGDHRMGPTAQASQPAPGQLFTALPRRDLMMYRSINSSDRRTCQDRKRWSYLQTLVLGSLVSLVVGALADPAQAQIVKINGVGSETGLRVVTAVVRELCDTTAGTPIHLRNGATDESSGLHTWLCSVTYSIPGTVPPIAFVGALAEIRYSVLQSGDAFTRLTGQYGTPLTASFIDPGFPTCTGPVTQGIPPFVYLEYSNCPNTQIDNVHFGVSEVAAASYGQSGPTGLSFPPDCAPVVPDCETPVSPAGLSVEPVAVVPFALFVNNGVRLQTSTGVGGVLENLSRTQVEAIFRLNPRDWNDLGYLVTSNGSTVDPAKLGLFLCLRDAGSGVKAAFDQTQMLTSEEVVRFRIFVNGMYSPTEAGVRDCIQSNVNAIGYLPADSVVADAHPIQLNGASANYSAADVAGNTSPIARKRDVVCGRYDFWTTLQVLRIAAFDFSNENKLIRALAHATSTNINAMPFGTHWVPLSEMVVDKGRDEGPISWKLLGGSVPSNPQCRP